MIRATQVIRALDIPRTTLYRLVHEQKIPAYRERKPWQRRGQLLFKLNEVRAALARMAEQQPT